MKVIIFGASGSGTTTLGNEIEKWTNFKHLDVDNYYWRKTEPPFQEKIGLKKRNITLKADFNEFKNVIVSGSMVSWGKEWENSFDLAIFIRLNNDLRMKRLETRETERYGKKLITDEKIQQNSKAFLEWADQYENPNFDGRSLKTHKNWIELLNCKTLEIDGKTDLNDKVKMVLSAIKTCYNNV